MTAPRMRAGTTDRQSAVDGLTRHFTEGRLDAGEFDERVGRAYAATHLDELPPLFADLPEDRPRRGPGSQARRPGPDHAGAFSATGGPGPWSGPHRPRFHRPPRILPVLVVLALLFSISAVSHGVFPFPLIWIVIIGLFMVKGRRRRRWADSARYDRSWADSARYDRR